MKVPRSYPHASGCIPAPVPVVFVLMLTSSCEPSPIVSTLRQIKRFAGWAQVESNYRPYPYQGYALAN